MPSLHPEQSTRRRRLLMSAASVLSVGILVVLVLAAEGLTRVAYHFGSRRFIHPFLGETQKPLHRRTDVSPEGERFTFTTNNYGFRGEDIREKKPVGAKYIFALGGSTTACNEYPHELTWPGLLQQHLRRLTGNDIYVFNAGMGSATSYHSLVTYVNLITRLDPDLLIVYEGVNDKGPFHPTNARYFRDIGHGEDFLQRPSYLLYELALHARHPMVTRAARSLYPAAVPDDGFTYHEKNYRDITYLARGYDTDVIFMTQPIMPDLPRIDGQGVESNEGINESTRRLGKQLNVPVFDLVATMPLDHEHFLRDGVHYTKRGNARIADQLAAWMVNQRLP